MNAKPTPKGLIKCISNALVSREDEAHAIVLSLVSKSHCLFVGPPGCAKSAIVNALAIAVDARMFKVLLTRFSTPEDIFGPVSVQGLKNSTYERVTKNRLADCDLSFVDEIFKANPAILNSMLTIMEEREFDNGGQRIKCDLRSVVAASNEWPEKGELDALFDRFLIRRTVHYVPRELRDDLLFKPMLPVNQMCDLNDIDQWQTEASRLPFSSDARECYKQCIITLEEEGIHAGDRRLRQAVSVARSEAYISGRSEVTPKDLVCLGDVLWARPEQSGSAMEIVTKLADPTLQQVNSYFIALDDICKEEASNASRMVEKTGKLEAMSREIASLQGDKADRLRERVRKEVLRTRAKMLNVPEERVAELLGT